MLFSHPLPDGAGNAIAQNGTTIDLVDVFRNELVDAGFQRLGIDALIAAAQLLLAVVHPDGRALRHQHPCRTAQLTLNFRAGQSRDPIAGVGHQRVISALACAVQPDDERQFLSGLVLWGEPVSLAKVLNFGGGGG